MRNTGKLILISLLLVVGVVVQSHEWKRGFNNIDFPKNEIFSSMDIIELDLSDYVTETYEVEEVEINPENLLNYQITAPFKSSSTPLSYETQDRNCKKTTLLSKVLDVVMLCGNDGTVLLRADYDKITVQAQSHNRYQIREIPALEGQNIAKCSSIADIEENGYVYVICHGAIAPHLKRTKREDLYILAFSTEEGKLQFRQYIKIN